MYKAFTTPKSIFIKFGKRRIFLFYAIKIYVFNAESEGIQINVSHAFIFGIITLFFFFKQANLIHFIDNNRFNKKRAIIINFRTNCETSYLS
jgi:hypothetical protein